MKTTLSWLKSHLDTEAPIAALAERGGRLLGVEMGLEPGERRLHAAAPPARAPRTGEGMSSGRNP